MIRAIAIAAAFTGAIALAGCGQKGPLRLPDAPKAPATTPSPAPAPEPRSP
ncbi:MAG TPA: lipoprotein [Usitatibacter sp.]|nr:lipoprotein [Usitatibacter sp.]